MIIMNCLGLHVTLLGFTVPDSMMQVILAEDENLPLQTHKFAWSLARAMRLGGADVQLISVPQVSNYPKMPQVLFRGERFSEDGFPGRTLSFINLIGFKHITRGIACAVQARQDIQSHGSHVILVHGVHSPFLWFAVAIRRKNRKVIVLMTDPPGVMLPTDGRLVRTLKTFDAWLIKAALKRVDGVIALTQALVDDFAPMVKGLVLPGFLDKYLESVPQLKPIKREPGKVFRIAYAGGLSVAYGVDRLIEAVMGIEDDSIKLDLYGKGELVERIKALSDSDKRISYCGSLPPAELAACLQNADLLVNPRPTGQDFVRHSFPSKLIEYMALGVPVITTRLPGIPDDYLRYMTIVDIETAKGLREAIVKLKMMSQEQRVKQANEARDFIYSVAKEDMQGKKIVAYFNSLVTGDFS